ncbi:hypothetical protein EVAR_5979_1 [Eumeta japonica]|uniref:Uncharacterized protein n=1 Tax=Eumeta variegata TaxID=151549 RepID=A0A4C1TCV6_EUMVA|nr:hypothetical protein EVAR_5979_1 [Eumeta japonica]
MPGSSGKSDKRSPRGRSCEEQLVENIYNKSDSESAVKRIAFEPGGIGFDPEHEGIDKPGFDLSQTIVKAARVAEHIKSPESDRRRSPR